MESAFGNQLKKVRDTLARSNSTKNPLHLHWTCAIQEGSASRGGDDILLSCDSCDRVGVVETTLLRQERDRPVDIIQSTFSARWRRYDRRLTGPIRMLPSARQRPIPITHGLRLSRVGPSSIFDLKVSKKSRRLSTSLDDVGSDWLWLVVATHPAILLAPRHG